MSKDLQSTIHQLAEDFSDRVLAALRAASLGEIQGGTSPHRADRAGRAGRTDRTYSAVAPKRRAQRPAPTTRRHKVEKRHENDAVVGADVLLDNLVETSRKFPAGLRSEELRALLKMEKVPFRVIAREAEDAGLIRRTGEKRSTTFFPK